MSRCGGLSSPVRIDDLLRAAYQERGAGELLQRLGWARPARVERAIILNAVRVGICEDDQQLQSVLARALSAEDFDVRVTATGRDAVRLFSQDPPDLLV